MDPGRASKHGKPPDVESDESVACSKISERRKVAHTSRASWEMERKREIDSCDQHGRPWRENAKPLTEEQRNRALRSAKRGVRSHYGPCDHVHPAAL